MPTRPLLSASAFRWAAALLVVFLLAGTLASLIFAIERFPGPRNRLSGAVIQVPTDSASVWPAATPHDVTWPTPEEWGVAREFGVWEHNVASGSHDTGGRFQMHVLRSGWPVPALQQKQMWWDWNNPALDGPDSDPAKEILYFGLAVNTLVVGGGAWLIVIALPLALLVAYRFWLRANRAIQGRCLSCGYEVGDMSTCPECGLQRQGPTKIASNA